MPIEFGNGPPPLQLAPPTGTPVTLSQPSPPVAVVVPGGGGGGAASQIANVGSAPAGVPLALVKGTDGLLRPDAAAIADRPTLPAVVDAIESAVAVHVADPQPHPAYDADIPSLSLLFASRLV